MCIRWNFKTVIYSLHYNSHLIWSRNFEISLRYVEIYSQNENVNIIFGGLDGTIRLIVLKIKDDKVTVIRSESILNLKGSVLASRKSNPSFEENESLRRFVFGTSNGQLACLSHTDSSSLVTDFVIKAHYPMKDYKDDRFGSLYYYAEIWSVCFSPNNDYMCSASEDQTVVIWDEFGTKVHTFVGHAAAVTCVDWQTLKRTNKEILVSCSDDQMAMIWMLNEKETKFKRKWILYAQLTTQGLGMDWHTLSYLRIIDDHFNCYLAVGTQIGYLAIWDLNDKTLKYRKKIQYGSIEGMSVVKSNTDSAVHLIATCASDCSVSLIEFKSDAV